MGEKTASMEAPPSAIDRELESLREQLAMAQKMVERLTARVMAKDAEFALERRQLKARIAKLERGRKA